MDLDWIALIPDKDKCPVVVKMVMNFQVPKYLGNFFTG